MRQKDKGGHLHGGRRLRGGGREGQDGAELDKAHDAYRFENITMKPVICKLNICYD